MLHTDNFGHCLRFFINFVVGLSPKVATSSAEGDDDEVILNTPERLVSVT